MYTRDIAKLEQYVGTWLDQKPTKFGEVRDQESHSLGDVLFLTGSF